MLIESFPKFGVLTEKSTRAGPLYKGAFSSHLLYGYYQTSQRLKSRYWKSDYHPFFNELTGLVSGGRRRHAIKIAEKRWLK